MPRPAPSQLRVPRCPTPSALRLPPDAVAIALDLSRLHDALDDTPTIRVGGRREGRAAMNARLAQHRHRLSGDIRHVQFELATWISTHLEVIRALDPDIHRVCAPLVHQRPNLMLAIARHAPSRAKRPVAKTAPSAVRKMAAVTGSETNAQALAVARDTLLANTYALITAITPLLVTTTPRPEPTPDADEQARLFS